jgi:hypothetical protein
LGIHCMQSAISFFFQFFFFCRSITLSCVLLISKFN